MNEKVSDEKARAGETGKGMRYVLAISTIVAAVILGIVLIYFV